MSEIQPFFIVACGRSGTSLLAVMLDSHPAIAIPPESHLFVRYGKLFQRYGDLENDRNLERFAADLLTDGRIREWRLDLGVPDFLAQIKERTVGGVISCLYRCYATAFGKKRWGDKTPRHQLHLQQILKTFPSCKIIHLVRDGRDVASSLKRVWFGPSTVYRSALLWKKYIHCFQEAKRTMREDQFMEVHFEDLVRDPNRTLGAILEFLREEKIPYGTVLPETFLRKTFMEKNGQDSLKGFLLPQKIGVYRNDLSPFEIRLIESVSGPELETCGYALNSKVSVKVGRLQKLSWNLCEISGAVRKRLRHPKTLRRELFLQLQCLWRNGTR